MATLCGIQSHITGIAVKKCLCHYEAVESIDQCCLGALTRRSEMRLPGFTVGLDSVEESDCTKTQLSFIKKKGSSNQHIYVYHRSALDGHQPVSKKACV